ncbi:MAG: glutamine amidotransferase [Thermoguttaceae bacterium]
MTISAWQIEFAQPLWFALLAALPLLLIFWRRSLVHASRGRKILSLLLRSLLLLLVAAGLAAPKATRPASLPIIGVKWELGPSGGGPPAVEVFGPDHVRAGEPFSLNVLVRSRATGKATVELLRDGQPLLRDAVQLAEGRNQKRFLTVVLKPSRVIYAVRVNGEQGAWPDDNGSACVVYVDPPPRVLLVESQPVLAEPLKKALAGENVAVEVPPELPVGQLAAYDLIILSNVPAAALPEPRMKALQTYVRDDRGGLIVVGGDRSFTAGGYRHTALEKILPVISEERKSKPKQTLAMVLVLDISASMNDPSANAKVRNIDLAKEALRTAVNMLGPRDQVGVLVFEDRSRWIWPLAPVTDKQRIIDKINTIQAEGSTNMYPPLEKAYLSLREAFADLKHIIVTTDGLGEPGDFDGLAQKMAAAGITMTTVGVGSEPAQPFLQSIADKAKGRAYFCPDAEKVPRIFQTDTGIVAKIGITEEPFFPQVVRPTQVLRGLDMSQAPTLLGYVETQARPGSQVVLASKTGEPILALWHYGGGITAAFTSDIQSRWAAPWLNWSGFGKFWVQLVRQAMRQDAPKTLRLETDAADSRLFFTLDAADRDGRFINGAEASVTVTGGDGKSSTAPLTQTAPGRYAGSQPAGRGTYWLEGQVRRDGKLIDSVRSGTVVLHMPEVVAKVNGTFEPAEKTGWQTMFLWPWLLGAGLVILVIDLAVRRTGRAAE